MDELQKLRPGFGASLASALANKKRRFQYMIFGCRLEHNPFMLAAAEAGEHTVGMEKVSTPGTIRIEQAKGYYNYRLSELQCAQAAADAAEAQYLETVREQLPENLSITGGTTHSSVLEGYDGDVWREHIVDLSGTEIEVTDIAMQDRDQSRQPYLYLRCGQMNYGAWLDDLRWEPVDKQA